MSSREMAPVLGISLCNKMVIGSQVWGSEFRMIVLKLSSVIPAPRAFALYSLFLEIAVWFGKSSPSG